jgi:hypothetical protein
VIGSAQASLKCDQFINDPKGVQNMRRGIWISVLWMAALLAPQSAALAQSRIGQAASVRPEAHVDARLLSTGTGVHANETVRTGSSGATDLRFNDSTNLSVGPSSSVRLDKFVYDPSRGAGGVTVSLTRGAARFVTGSQSRGEYTIKTPYGTLGVRG